jgi:hypothetical protein
MIYLINYMARLNMKCSFSRSEILGVQEIEDSRNIEPKGRCGRRQLASTTAWMVVLFYSLSIVAAIESTLYFSYFFRSLSVVKYFLSTGDQHKQYSCRSSPGWPCFLFFFQVKIGTGYSSLYRPTLPSRRYTHGSYSEKCFCLSLE